MPSTSPSSHSSTPSTATSYDAYSINADTLLNPSAKPHHVALRFASRSPIVSSTSSSSSSSSSSSHTSRSQILSQRRDRLRAQRLSRQAAVASRQEELRACRSSRLQLSLETASHRRLRLLQSQRSRCADAVAHAKEVARANRERRAREASTLIQDWWRRHSLAKLFREFRSAGGSMARIRAASSFPSAARLAQDPSLIHATARLLGRILILSQVAEGRHDQGEAEEPMRKVRNRTRTFLSSFLLLAYPDDTLMGMSNEEESETLTRVAKRMLGRLRTLERIVTGQDSPQSSGMFDPILKDAGAAEIKSFTQAWRSYHRTFLSWKVKDRQTLLDTLCIRYQGLGSLWMQLQGQEDKEAWREEIRIQQDALLHEAHSLANEEGVRYVQGDCKMEVKGQEDTSPLSSPISDPSMVQAFDHHPPPPGSSKNRDSVLDGIEENGTHKASQAPGETYNAQSTIQSIGWENIELAHALCVEPDFNLERFERDQILGNLDDPDFLDGPEDHSPLNAIRMDAQGNILVHDAREAQRIQRHLEEINMRAIGDKVAEAWDGPSAKQDASDARAQWVRMITSELRNKLQSFLLSSSNPQSKEAASMGQGTQRLSRDIDAILGEESTPVETALAAVRSGFGMSELANVLSQVMTGLVSRMCAPIRDSTVRDILKSIHTWSSASSDEGQGKELVSIFRSILQLLDSMKKDLRQYQVESLIPTLRECGVEYERSKFRESLSSSSSSSSSVNMEKTKSWLKIAAHTLEKERDQRDPEGVQAPEARVRFAQVYTTAFINLLLPDMTSSSSSSPLDVTNSLPETLALDARRINRWSREIRRITVACSLALLMRNASGRVRVNASPELASGLVKELIILLARVPLWKRREEGEEREGDGQSEDAIKNLVLFMEQRVSQSMEEPSSLSEGWAKRMVQRVLQGHEPVCGLLTRRIRALLTYWLTLPEDQEGDQSTLHWDEERRRRMEVAERQGLIGVYEDLEKIGLGARRVTRWDRQVHAPWYDPILRNCL